MNNATRKRVTIKSLQTLAHHALKEDGSLLSKYGLKSSYKFRSSVLGNSEVFRCR